MHALEYPKPIEYIIMIDGHETVGAPKASLPILSSQKALTRLL